jgi:3-deoxy-D-manno-octulosonic-acid transferase
MMARFLYNLLLLVLLPYVALHLLGRGRRQPEYLRHLGERFGIYPFPHPAPLPGANANSGGLIWLHAVSVGETRAAQPLVDALQGYFPHHRILLTHMTPTGRATSEQIFGERVLRVYLPYDYPWAVRRFLDHFRPCAGIIMETEIWPNLVSACHARGLPLLLVNARLSENSARRYSRFSSLSRQALIQLSGIAAQSEGDAARLRGLGAPRVEVLGNLKFDIVPPRDQLVRGQSLRRLIGGRPVLLAASTRKGEEALLLDALAGHALDGALLVIVPRHPQRFDEVAAIVEERGFALQRRSAGMPIAAATRVLLGDSMGEMFAYYAACDLAFVGGSLLEFGGQNLIEACAVGTPVLLGPSTFNFAAAAEQALACGAARRIASAEDLLEVAGRLLVDARALAAMGEAGEKFAARHRGATAKTLDLISRAMR